MTQDQLSDSPPATTVADLAGLRDGTLRWMHDNATYLDSPTVHTQTPMTPHAKAILQLGTLRRHWSRVAPADAGLAQVTEFLDGIWPSPGFHRLITADSKIARQFWLIYAAMAPPGHAGQLPEDVPAQLAADGFLTSRARTAGLRLTIRYYASIAGIEHDMDPYSDIYWRTQLGQYNSEHPAADLDVCDVTQTLFYLSDYGSRAPGLTDAERDLALRALDELTDDCIRHNEWELAVKLMLAQFCLGGDPLHTASGVTAISQLAQSQAACGAIPGRSLARRIPESATRLEFFRKSYQPTLVTALMTLIISARQ